MDTLNLSGWLVLSIAFIVTVIAVAEVIEGKNRESRMFASLDFSSKIEQRICRILWAVVCPVLFVAALVAYGFESKMSVDNFGEVIVLGFVLFIWRYVAEVLLYALLGLSVMARWFVKKLCCKKTWQKFQNWLWEYNKY